MFFFPVLLFSVNKDKKFMIFCYGFFSAPAVAASMNGKEALTVKHTSVVAHSFWFILHVKIPVGLK